MTVNQANGRMVGSFSRLVHSTPIFARPSFCHTCGRATALVSARSLARMRGLGLRLRRLTRAPRCPRRTCTSPCAGACASRCPSRTGIAEAMGSQGAAPRSMSWATMRQRARAAGCWPAAPPCLNKRGSASRVKVWDPRAGLSLSSGWPPGVSVQDRRRLDLVLYGATRLGEALCCDATLVAPLRRDGRPQPRAAEEDGAAIAVARRRKEARYPELCRPGPQRLVVLACETGGRWGPEACGLVDRLVRLRALRAPLAVRRAAERAGAAGGGHCSAPPCSAPSLPLCSEDVGFPPRGRLCKESPTSPMSLVWLARPGPAFCLCAASRHVGARASLALLGGRFGWGGLRVPCVSLPPPGRLLQYPPRLLSLALRPLGWPSLPIGLTSVMSMATWATCHTANADARISMHRASDTGTSTFRQARRRRPGNVSPTNHSERALV